MGKNRNRHKTKNNKPPKTNTSNTLGDFLKEQGISVKKLKTQLKVRKKKNGTQQNNCKPN